MSRRAGLLALLVAACSLLVPPGQARAGPQPDDAPAVDIDDLSSDDESNAPEAPASGPQNPSLQALLARGNFTDAEREMLQRDLAMTRSKAQDPGTSGNLRYGFELWAGAIDQALRKDAVEKARREMERVKAIPNPTVEDENRLRAGRDLLRSSQGNAADPAVDALISDIDRTIKDTESKRSSPAGQGEQKPDDRRDSAATSPQGEDTGSRTDQTGSTQNAGPGSSSGPSGKSSSGGSSSGSGGGASAAEAALAQEKVGIDKQAQRGVGKAMGMAAALKEGLRGPESLPGGSGKQLGGRAGPGGPASQGPGGPMAGGMGRAGSSGDPANPRDNRDLALAAGPYKHVFDQARLKVGAPSEAGGQPRILRSDGSDASPQELDDLRSRIGAEPSALSRNPQYFNTDAGGISRDHFMELKSAYKSDPSSRDKEFKDIALSPADTERDFQRSRSCEVASGDCNPKAEKSYKKGEDVPPTDLNKIWDEISGYLTGVKERDQQRKTTRDLGKSSRLAGGSTGRVRSLLSSLFSSFSGKPSSSSDGQSVDGEETGPAGAGGGSTASRRAGKSGSSTATEAGASGSSAGKTTSRTSGLLALAALALLSVPFIVAKYGRR